MQKGGSKSMKLSKLQQELLIKKTVARIETESKSIATLAKIVDYNSLLIAEELIGCKGHIIVSGVGTSRSVAERFAHLLACVGVPALSINAPDGLHGASGAITKKDIVYLITKSGHTPEIVQMAKIARERNAKVIVQTQSKSSPVSKLANIVYEINELENAEIDGLGLIAIGSSLLNSAACNVICWLILEQNGFSVHELGAIHPNGFVGTQIKTFLSSAIT